jgi:PAS domain S-box-containing protein
MSLFAGTSKEKIISPSPQDQNPPNKKRKSAIHQKSYGRGLIWISSLVLVVFTVIIAGLILSKIEGQIRHDINVTLNTVLNTTQEALHNSVLKRLTEVTSWGLSSELKRLVKEQMNVPRNPQALLASPVLAKMRALLQPVMAEKNYVGFFIITPDNISIASMRDVNVGTPNRLSGYEEFLPRIFDGNVLISKILQSDVLLLDALGKLSKDQPTMFVAAPISENGVTIAVLTFRVDPVGDFSRITRLGGIGETGETYAFDETGKLLTESRFDQQLRRIGLIEPAMRSILNVQIRDPGVNLLEGLRPTLPRSKQPLTYMAQQATRGRSGVNLDGYRDYRGVPVVGAWLWNEELNFGLTSEIDRLEAYQAYHTTRWALMIGLVLTVALSLGLSITLDLGRRRAIVLAGEIEENQTLLRGILDNLVEGVVTINESGAIQSFNPAAEKIFGYQESELIGQPINLLMPEPDKSEHAEHMKRFSQTGQARIIGSGREVLGLQKNGTIFPLDLSVGEMVMGERHWFVGVIRDITERKRLEEELRKLSQAVEQSPTSVIITNLKGDIEYVNSKFTQVTGFLLEEVIGKNPRFLKSGETPAQEYKNLWKTISAGKEWHGEFHNKKKNSELYWELAYISPIKDKEGVITHYLAVKEDITLQKKTEMDLQKEIMFNQLLKDVAVASNEATVMEEAVQVCLKLVCELTGWPVGHLYVSDENFIGLVPTDTWHLDDPNRFATFKKVTEAFPFSPGVGLPGRILSSRKPLWIKDINKDPNFPRAKHTKDLGVKAGFGFPILVGKKTVAVLEFFSTETIEPDDDLLGVMENIGTQLGNIAERNQAEEKLKKSQQELRDLYNRLESIREEERTRISREIHDELGQMLTALKIDLSWLGKRINNRQKLVLERTQTMSTLIDKTIQSVQTISTNLRPEVLDMLGLTDAIEWQAQEFQKRTGIECNINSSLCDLDLDPDLSTAIFRILQETLTNVARHAGASKINIEFHKKNCTLTLEVQDNGKGISKDQVSHSKSLGLIGIRERALLWNGQVKISGIKGKGTTVTVKIQVN